MVIEDLDNFLVNRKRGATATDIEPELSGSLRLTKVLSRGDFLGLGALLLLQCN